MSAVKHGVASALYARAVKRVRYKTPVPSDLRISQSLRPLPIGSVARACGILPRELESYGRYKGKVSLGVLERLLCDLQLCRP